MDTIILFILLIGAYVGLVFQNKKIKKLKNYIDTIPKAIPNINIEDDPFAESKPVNTNRRGIIKYPVIETIKSTGNKKTYNTIVEVEETEKLGNNSRIKIKKISGYGDDDDIKKHVESHLAEIVVSTRIEFF